MLLKQNGNNDTAPDFMFLIKQLNHKLRRVDRMYNEPYQQYDKAPDIQLLPVQNTLREANAVAVIVSHKC